MKIAVHKQPSGHYLVIPKKQGVENSPLWGRQPVLVFDTDTVDRDIDDAIHALFGREKDYTVEGSPSNAFVGILTTVFTEGIRFEKKRDSETT